MVDVLLIEKRNMLTAVNRNNGLTILIWTFAPISFMIFLMIIRNKKNAYYSWATFFEMIPDILIEDASVLITRNWSIYLYVTRLMRISYDN